VSRRSCWRSTSARTRWRCRVVLNVGPGPGCCATDGATGRVGHQGRPAGRRALRRPGLARSPWARAGSAGSPPLVASPRSRPEGAAPPTWPCSPSSTRRSPPRSATRAARRPTSAVKHSRGMTNDLHNSGRVAGSERRAGRDAVRAVADTHRTYAATCLAPGTRPTHRRSGRHRHRPGTTGRFALPTPSVDSTYSQLACRCRLHRRGPDAEGVLDLLLGDHQRGDHPHDVAERSAGQQQQTELGRLVLRP